MKTVTLKPGVVIYFRYIRIYTLYMTGSAGVGPRMHHFSAETDEVRRTWSGQIFV